MACGNLVIVSNSGTLPELIDDCGLVIEENNAKAIENQLKACLHDLNSFKPFREKAQVRANNYLTVNKQAEIISEIIYN